MPCRVGRASTPVQTEPLTRLARSTRTPARVSQEHHSRRACVQARRSGAACRWGEGTVRGRSDSRVARPLPRASDPPDAVAQAAVCVGVVMLYSTMPKLWWQDHRLRERPAGESAAVRHPIVLYRDCEVIGGFIHLRYSPDRRVSVMRESRAPNILMHSHTQNIDFVKTVGCVPP